MYVEWYWLTVLAVYCVVMGLVNGILLRRLVDALDKIADLKYLNERARNLLQDRVSVADILDTLKEL